MGAAYSQDLRGRVFRSLWPRHGHQPDRRGLRRLAGVGPDATCRSDALTILAIAVKAITHGKASRRMNNPLVLSPTDSLKTS